MAAARAGRRRDEFDSPSYRGYRACDFCFGLVHGILSAAVIYLVVRCDLALEPQEATAFAGGCRRRIRVIFWEEILDGINGIFTKFTKLTEFIRKEELISKILGMGDELRNRSNKIDYQNNRGNNAESPEADSVA